MWSSAGSGSGGNNNNNNNTSNKVLSSSFDVSSVVDMDGVDALLSELEQRALRFSQGDLREERWLQSFVDSPSCWRLLPHLLSRVRHALSSLYVAQCAEHASSSLPSQLRTQCSRLALQASHRLSQQQQQQQQQQQSSSSFRRMIRCAVVCDTMECVACALEYNNPSIAAAVLQSEGRYCKVSQWENAQKKIQLLQTSTLVVQQGGGGGEWAELASCRVGGCLEGEEEDACWNEGWREGRVGRWCREALGEMMGYAGRRKGERRKREMEWGRKLGVLMRKCEGEAKKHCMKLCHVLRTEVIELSKTLVDECVRWVEDDPHMHILACAALRVQLLRRAALWCETEGRMGTQQLVDVRPVVGCVLVEGGKGGKLLQMGSVDAAGEEEEDGGGDGDGDGDGDEGGGDDHAAVAAGEAAWRRLKKTVEGKENRDGDDEKRTQYYEKTVERAVDVLGAAMETDVALRREALQRCVTALRRASGQGGGGGAAGLLWDCGCWCGVGQRALECCGEEESSNAANVWRELEESSMTLLEGLSTRADGSSIWAIEQCLGLLLTLGAELWERSKSLSPICLRSLRWAHQCPHPSARVRRSAERFAGRILLRLRHLLPSPLPFPPTQSPFIRSAHVAIALHNKPKEAPAAPLITPLWSTSSMPPLRRFLLSAYLVHTLHDMPRNVLLQMFEVSMAGLSPQAIPMLANKGDPDSLLDVLAALHCCIQSVPSLAPLVLQFPPPPSPLHAARLLTICFPVIAINSAPVAPLLQLTAAATRGFPESIDVRCAVISMIESLMVERSKDYKAFTPAERSQLLVFIMLKGCLDPSIQRLALNAVARVSRLQPSIFSDKVVLQTPEVFKIVADLLQHCLRKNVPSLDQIYRIIHLLGCNVDWSMVTSVLVSWKGPPPERPLQLSTDLYAFQKSLEDYLHDLALVLK